MVTHTPGPLQLEVDDDVFVFRMGTALQSHTRRQPQHEIEWSPGLYYDSGEGDDDPENQQYLEARENARRLVAAWNAVQGIPTEALEAGVVSEMREALKHAQIMLEGFLKDEVLGSDERDEAQWVLERHILPARLALK